MKIACAVMVFDRPQYFRDVFYSLMQNTYNSNVHWHFYFDGRQVNRNRMVGDKQGLKQCINIASYAPAARSFFHLSDHNKGIARQKQRAHKLFDEYEQVLFFEDDMIVSPYYIQLLVSLQEQFPNDIVGAPDHTKHHLRNAPLNHVHDKNEHLWGYSLRAESFFKFKDKYDAYCADVGDDYMRRPSNRLKEKYSLRISSHDCAIGTFSREVGIRRINTLVPRGKYIGEYGMNFKPNRYKERGFGKDWVIEFPADNHLKEFELVQ